MSLAGSTIMVYGLIAGVSVIATGVVGYVRKWSLVQVAAADLVEVFALVLAVTLHSLFWETGDPLGSLAGGIAILAVQGVVLLAFALAMDRRR